MPTIEIINTGSELLAGSTLNTHQQWLCRILHDHGYKVVRQTTISDTGAEIAEAVKEARNRAQIIVTTGGLGPTSDDLTREAIAESIGANLIENPEVLARIRGFFESRGKEMPDSTAVQAMVLEGADVFQNDHGTAPGLAMRLSGTSSEMTDSFLVMLPGPPRELYPMFREKIIPYLAAICPTEKGFESRFLRVCGLGESRVQELVEPGLTELIARGLEVGYCARLGEVDIRLSMRGEGGESPMQQAITHIMRELGNSVFADAETSIEEVVVRLLEHKSLKLAVAESCTGGFISHRITNVSGASNVLLAGFVTYSNEAKMRDLDVSGQTLHEHGAVSKDTAQEMADGARHRTGADYAIAVTGIAGPTGGSKDKPMGTVYIALATPRGTKVIRSFNPFDRESFKFATSQQALDLLRKSLLKNG